MPCPAVPASPVLYVVLGRETAAHLSTQKGCPSWKTNRAAVGFSLSGKRLRYAPITLLAQPRASVAQTTLSPAHESERVWLHFFAWHFVNQVSPNQGGHSQCC